MSYRFDFLKSSKITFWISSVLVVASLLIVIVPMLIGSTSFGLNAGLDFTGGTQLIVNFQTPVSIEQVRATLDGVEVGGEGLSSSTIHTFNDLPNTLSIRMQLSDEDEIDAAIASLELVFPAMTVERREVIGSQISKELVSSGWQSTVLVLIVIMLYLTWRFRFRFALGAVLALMHDVIIALGIFALLRIEITLPVIAAFLTIVGYSVNDTIVIFDRIRENMGANRRGDPYEQINLSLNQTLSRTIHTSLTTFMPVLVLTVFGGTVLFGFSFALLLGVLIGTYSSIFVASPLVNLWSKRASN